jgi:nucleoid-associated protein YgaU
VIEESPSRTPRVVAADAGGDTAAPAVPTAEPTGARTHVVKAGETLGVIAAKEYGSAKQWKRILDANPGLDPARLHLGQRLVIPANPVDAPRH